MNERVTPTNERVTWLLPVRNGMPYLTQTLASIEAQTYRDFEVLAWDNNSTDDTNAELRRWIPSRLPGRIIDDEPLSLGASLKRLVEESRTELCARIDADDVAYPERLARQVAFLTRHSQVGMVGAQIEFIDEEGRVCAGAWRQPLDDAELRWRVRWECPFNHPTVLFRRSVVLKAGNYAEFMPEDHDLWVRIARVAEVANLPSVLLKYRRLPTSFTAVMTGWQSAAGLFEKTAEQNAAQLFGNLTGEEALSFRKRVAESSTEDVSIADLLRLHRVAGATALAAGKPASYFRGTSHFAAQRRGIIGRLLRQHKLGRLSLAGKKALTGITARSTRTPDAP